MRSESLSWGNIFSENVKIVRMEVENGRAVIELSLPECFTDKEEYFHIYLWDENGLPVFHCIRSMREEESCIIQLLHPHLWEGVKRPYLYRLEVYVADALSLLGILHSCFLALYSLQEIPQKGWFLNGQAFLPKSVYYDNVDTIFANEEQSFGLAQEQGLEQLVKMGANEIRLGTVDGITGREYMYLQECCNRRGLILRTGCKNDECVSADMLFHKIGLPTKVYYQYKARWSKEPFVYICQESFLRQPNGDYTITVYSNQKKVALFVNGAMFAFQQDGPEFCFQDIQIKGLPVKFTAESEHCSMSVVCYEL